MITSAAPMSIFLVFMTVLAASGAARPDPSDPRPEQ
jgi:hypothetical protein